MPRLLALAALLALASTAAAQTAPTPHDLAAGDYTFDAWAPSQPAGTYPASMRFHRSAGTQDPLPTDAFAADYTGAYNLTAGTRVVGLGADGVSFLNTGTAGTLGAATLALRTIGLQNVRVAWTGGTAASGTRPYVLRLQWRAGTTGAFQDAGSEYVAAATGDAAQFATVLPAGADDQPVVHVRWVYAQTGAGAGTRPALRLDAVTVSTSDSPASGTGIATFAPDVLRGGQTHTVALTVAAVSDAPADLLTHVDLTLPDAWPEPTAGQISTLPAGATVAVSGRTVRVSGLAATASAPVTISVAGVAIPDASAFVEVGVRTGAGSAQTVALPDQPVLRVWSTPEPISAVRANNASGQSTRLGQAVTVQGVVTVARQFRTGTGERGPSYLEDATGGLAVFSPEGVSAVVEVGEEVVLMGRVDQFFGLNQLNDETTVVARIGTPGAPAPPTLTLAQIASQSAANEIYESRLVRVAGVTVNTTVWNSEGSGTNYLLTDASGTLDVRVNPGVDFANQPAPTGPFDVVGVVSQFRPSAPFQGGYQLMPRASTDLTPLLDAPVIAPTAPFETAATPTSVTVRWTTDAPSHTEVRWTNPVTGETGGVSVEERTTTHEITLTDLDAATVYRLDLRSSAGADTARVAGYPVVTRSTSTGTIEALFNQSVDATVATGPVATGNADFDARLIARINAATQTVDVALYSLSGSAGAGIASALVAAHQRGVRVRVIMDDETSSTAPPGTITSAGIPLITDAFGGNDPAPLHHNKFVVVDRASPATAWVMTGSWNPTDPGTDDHQQNVLWVQDASMAAVYTEEFEQMWGGRGAQPVAASSRFGVRKTQVSPSVVRLGETDVRVLFSPQGAGAYGSTEAHILRALATADSELALNLNLITRLPIVDAVRARHDAGVTVRGVVGETTTTGSVFAELAAFADVLAFPSDALGLLHHKAALVDAQSPDSDPMVITGSHNWSRAANESNNENTVIVASAALANLYLQEFVARYREAGGTGQFPTSADDAPGGALSVSAPFPNPARGAARVSVTLPAAASVTLRVINVLGQEVARTDAALAAGATVLDVGTRDLAAGVYLVRVETPGATVTRRVTVVR